MDTLENSRHNFVPRVPPLPQPQIHHILLLFDQTNEILFKPNIKTDMN